MNNVKIIFRFTFSENKSLFSGFRVYFISQ